jgi:hypothetical protein
MQDVSNQMFQKFTEAMRAELEKPEAAPPAPPVGDGGGGGVPAGEAGAAPAATAASAPPAGSTQQGAPPIEVLSFGTKVLVRAAGRTIRKPLFWVVTVVVFGSIYWFLR